MHWQQKPEYERYIGCIGRTLFCSQNRHFQNLGIAVKGPESIRLTLKNTYLQSYIPTCLPLIISFE